MSLDTSARTVDSAPAAAQRNSAALHRERVRFANFAFTRTPSGHCTADVELEYEGQRVSGHCTGQSSPLGDLRIAADAALRALEEFTERALRFEMLGVKLIRAFDANLVIVSVGQLGTDAPVRLVGCFLAETDIRRGAAVAVLNATNRVLGNYIATR